MYTGITQPVTPSPVNFQTLSRYLAQGASALLDWAVWSGLLTGRRVLELGSGLGQVRRMMVVVMIID